MDGYYVCIIKRMGNKRLYCIFNQLERMQKSHNVSKPEMDEAISETPVIAIL